MDDSNSFQRLVDHVMSERQAKVYLALLRIGRATSAELQKASGIPQSKIYEIVRLLVSLGFCKEIKVGNKRTFKATDPRIAMKSKVHVLQSHLQEINSLKEDLYQLYTNADQRDDPLEFIEILHGNENNQHKYCQLVRNAKEEILGFGRPPYAADNPDNLEEQDHAYDEFTARKGTTSRWVYELIYPDHKWILKGLERGQKMGERYRIAQSLPLKMMIFDRRQVLVAQEDHYSKSGEFTTTLIKQKAVADAFCALFEFFWNQSIELDAWKNQHVHLPDVKEEKCRE